MRRKAALAARAYVVVAFAYLFAPVLSVTLFSFQTGRVQTFPIRGFTLEWYASALTNSAYREGITTSVIVAVCVAVISTVLGFAGAHLLCRRSPRWPLLYSAFVSMPAFIPLVLSGLVLLIYFQKIWIYGSLFGVIAAQACYCSPFAFVVIYLSYQKLNVEVEQAARNLGAEPTTILISIVLPQLYRPLIATLLLTALVSWDEFILAFFVGGFTKTLPTVIYASLATSFDPSINAIGVSVTICSASLLILVSRLAPSQSRLAG
jgi:spermidine/putrescine transport system permease protein